MPDYKVVTFEHDSREEKAFYDTAADYGVEIHTGKEVSFGDMEWIVEASDDDAFLDWYFDTGKSWASKDYYGKPGGAPKRF